MSPADDKGTGADGAARGSASELVLPPVVQIYPDREALAEAAAERVAHLLAAVIEERGAASLALAGGSTPRPVYERLAEAAGAGVDWSRVDVYWGDERAVPADHEASNYLMARRALLDRVPINPGHVHRIQGERSAEEAARLYEVELILTLGKRQRKVAEDEEESAEERAHGDDDPEYRKLKQERAELREREKRRGLDALHLDRVRLDLNLLGLGDDGHTASLFPAAFAGHETDPGYDPHPRRLAAATRAPDPPHDRITLSLSTLSAARRTVFLVSGEDKAEAVARVMEARGELDVLLAADADGRDAGGRKVVSDTGPPVSGPIPPAARVRPTKAPALWLLDMAAASRLPAPEA